MSKWEKNKQLSLGTQEMRIQVFWVLALSSRVSFFPEISHECPFLCVHLKKIWINNPETLQSNPEYPILNINTVETSDLRTIE